MKINYLIERITLTILAVFIFQTSFCQENYLPGYIILLKGDTIHGFIDYRNRERNPDKIFFKEKLSDSKTKYAPLDIKEFGVPDEIYESAIVKTEISSLNANELEFNAELKIEIDTTFLQTMIQGVKCLYLYRNKFDNDQYYIKKDISYELLVYKKYLENQEGIKVVTENKRYRGQLSLYLYDCPTIQSKLENTKYEKKSLEDIFLFYYNCTQSGIKFQKKTEKISTEIGILAGMSLTYLKFSSQFKTFAYLINTDFHQSVNFPIGLFIELILPRNQRKWSICNELSFSSYKVNGSFDDYKNINEYTISNITFGYSYLKMINVLRYKYPIGNIFIYLNAGISNGFVISETNYLKQETKFYFTIRDEEDKALRDTRKYEQGYTFGLGTKFKKYSFEIRWEKGNGMSEFTALSSSTTKYYFLLGYRF